MKIKLDENLPVSSVAILREAGFDADRVFDEGLSGKPDEQIWRRVTEEKRFFITLDLDFSDVRKYASGSHAGILIIRVNHKSAQSVTSIISRLIKENLLERLQGKFAVANETFTRIR